MERAVEALKRKGLKINEQLLSHLSPLGWEHINLSGDYIRKSNRIPASGRFRRLTVAIGIWGAVTASAAALGPLLGGALLAHFWWGSVFLINVPVVLLTLLFTFVLIPGLPGNAGRHWDLLTTVVLTIALISSLYAIKSVLKRRCGNDCRTEDCLYLFSAGYGVHYRDVLPGGRLEKGK
ncbi:hypothetical protein DNI83_21835 [Salmonella enterica subsp. salamae serovar Sofia]|nr:hypothetical protein [Salmonella enterica subsp. salamae serovar Sofia]